MCLQSAGRSAGRRSADWSRIMSADAAACWLEWWKGGPHGFHHPPGCLICPRYCGKFQEWGAGTELAGCYFHSILLAKAILRGSQILGGNADFSLQWKEHGFGKLKHQYTTDGKDVRKCGKEDLLISPMKITWRFMALILDGDIIKSHWKKRRDWVGGKKEGIGRQKERVKRWRGRKGKEEERTWMNEKRVNLVHRTKLWCLWDFLLDI